MKGCFGKYSCNSSTCYICKDEPECIDNTLNILIDEIKQEEKKERISKTDYYLEIAKTVSKRSTCFKKHYGAIIVKNDEIIATGYNGSPRGCINCSDIGKCSRKEEGNHFRNDGNYGSCKAVHAEQNAMISASRNEMQDSIMYLYGEEYKYDDLFEDEVLLEIKNPEPCPICARMLLNAGIKYVANNEKLLRVKDYI